MLQFPRIEEVRMTTTTKHPDIARAHAPTVTVAGSVAQYFDSELDLMPGVRIPLRSMLVSSGSEHILISPVGTAEEAAYVGDSLTTLVAPSLLHHLHMKDALERYQPNTVWGPPGFARKKPELGSILELGLEDWPHGGELDFVIVEGAPRRNEVVFFHRASRTIYTADLVFNIRKPHGFLTPLMFRMMGIHKRFAVMKMWRRWVIDRDAFQRSIRQILAWDFDRIVMAHGDTVDVGAHAKLANALREVGLFA
jgi:hypothetical protein